MRKFQGAAALIAELHALDGRVDISMRTRARIDDGDVSALIDATYLVVEPDREPRTMWTPWCEIEVLRRVPWGSAALGDLLEEWLLPHSAVADLFDGSFGDADVPPTVTPSGPVSLEGRVRRWALAVLLTAWQRHGAATRTSLRPTTRIDVAACEYRIGTALPENLRIYQLALGASETAEEVLSAAPGTQGYAIEPLLDAYPSIPELLESRSRDRTTILGRMQDLVVFSAYLGNGNYWCFERGSGAVWYFDHDGPEPLTRMFDDVGDYFDALAVRAIGDAHEMLGDENTSEATLTEMIGAEHVRAWLY